MKKLTTIAFALSLFVSASALNGESKPALSAASISRQAEIDSPKVIAFKDLPSAISRELFMNYSDYKFAVPVEEIRTESGVFYIVSGQNDTHKTQLRCFPDGTIELIKKEKLK